MNVNDENENLNEPLQEKPAVKGKIFFYVAIALCVLSAVAYGLSFTFMGIYALISSILLGLGSLSFCTAQKKKNNFKHLLYVKICAYVIFGIAFLTFIGGLIYSAVV
ncbi:MAG: hypothetical protein K2N30_05070 [Clostridia bacterium]|nr:hypothetical protein [Clostridia bacterium]